MQVLYGWPEGSSVVAAGNSGSMAVSSVFKAAIAGALANHDCTAKQLAVPMC